MGEWRVFIAAVRDGITGVEQFMEERERERERKRERGRKGQDENDSDQWYDDVIEGNDDDEEEGEEGDEGYDEYDDGAEYE